MIAYAPFRRPLLGQAVAPSDELLGQLLKLQGEVGTAIQRIPPGSVDQVRTIAINRKLDQCIALGPTNEAIKCLTDLRADVQTLSPGGYTGPTPAPLVWPWIAGGLALAGVGAWLLFSK